MPEVVAACLWPCTPAVLLALEEHFGEPTDAYVNGSQVWIRDDGPGGVTLEWRLHPVPGFRRPPGIGVHELFEAACFALRGGDDPPAPVEALWEGLEAFPGFGDEVEPAPLARACREALGLAPEVFGIVDHDRVGDDWERSGGAASIMASLRAQLDP